MTVVVVATRETVKKGSVWFPKTPSGAPRRWPSGKIKYRGKVTWPDGRRQDVGVPEKHCQDEAHADEHIAWRQEQMDKHGTAALTKLQPAPVDPKLADDWLEAWLASKVAKGQTSTSDRRGHYVHHIKSAVGGKHVRDWTSGDMRALVSELDAKIVDGSLAAKSARNIWGTATKMCADAVKSKVAALRCRDDNPAKDVEGPERGEDKAKQFLYPNEFLQILSCAKIPQRWRRAIALAVCMFPRAGELRSLRWADVDIEHGTVHIHSAFERRTRVEKTTKTGKGRRFSIEPSVLPLLKAMHDESGGEGLVCPLPNRMADRLRGWLETAEVRRAELLDVKSATTKALGFHDLRATGLTWMAVRGDDPLKIQQRAGHEDFATTAIYIRTAEAIREGFGEPFPPLPASLLTPAVSTPRVYRDRKLNDSRAGHGIRNRNCLTIRLVFKAIRVRSTRRRPPKTTRPAHVTSRTHVKWTSA